MAEFLDIELQINVEWQAAFTVRLFRTGQWLFSTRGNDICHRLLWKLWILAERVWFHTVLNADIPASVDCGLGVRFAHGARGVVLHPNVGFGRGCVIYHSVTVGSRGVESRVPRIGDGVILGAGCVVLGDLTVGDGAAIGPNAVVVTDIPARTHAVAPSPVLRPFRARDSEGEARQDQSPGGDMDATLT